jgi:hypothetical protein
MCYSTCNLLDMIARSTSSLRSLNVEGGVLVLLELVTVVQHYAYQP